VLRALGADAERYIPDREEEGYGLTPGIYATIMPGLDLRVGPSIGLGNRPEDFKLRGTLLFEL